VSVVVANSGIRVNDGAELMAGGGIEAEAKSDISVKTSAAAGKLPLSLAISAVVNDVHTIVDGAKLDAKHGDIRLTAEGSTTVETKSTKGASQSASGGFFAIDVAVQDVGAEILNSKDNRDMSIHAAGDILVNSVAKAVLYGQVPEYSRTTAKSALYVQLSGRYHSSADHIGIYHGISRHIFGIKLVLNRCLKSVLGTDRRAIHLVVAAHIQHVIVDIPLKAGSGISDIA
jgi:hypothetical protein